MKTRSYWAGLLSLAVGVGALIGSSIERARASGISAATPMTYSGVLTDSTGTPLTGSKNVQLSVYDKATGGTLQCTVGPTPVTLANGGFQLPLPDTCTTVVHANPDLWIEVFVDGASMGRTKLGAVPYAVEAAHAQTADSALSAASAIQVNQSGFTTCQPITNFRTTGWNNVLVRAALFSDSTCATAVDQSPNNCHTWCAAQEVLDPVHFAANCCNVGTYYTNGVVTVLQYK